VLAEYMQYFNRWRSHRAIGAVVYVLGS
jgi:hypothetical protein